jgi:hypothetical protein
MGFLLIERSGDSPDRMADLAEIARTATHDYAEGDAIDRSHPKPDHSAHLLGLTFFSPSVDKPILSPHPSNPLHCGFFRAAN